MVYCAFFIRGKRGVGEEAVMIFLKRVIKVAIFCIMFIVLFIKVSSILESKTSIKKYNDFYTETEEYDVLFFGSSHMWNTILPMELYKEYGIYSYNMANATEAIPTSYWVIKNTIEYKKPKVIVLETFMSGWGKKVLEGNENYLHTYYDVLPFSKTKLDAIKDIVDEGERAEYLVPFSLYHSRWNELGEDDFSCEYSVEKGAQALWETTPFEYATIETSELVEVNPVTKEYVQRVKQICDENDIELLLTEIPFCMDESEKKQNNGWKKFAEEIGVTFISCDDFEIDYENDMRDRGHFNYAGAKKATNYLGKYLIDNYKDIFFNHTEGVWKDDYAKYVSFLNEQIVETNDLDKCLLLLQSDEYLYDVEIKSIDTLQCNKRLSSARQIVTNTSLNNNISVKIYSKETEEYITEKIFD